MKKFLKQLVTGSLVSIMLLTTVAQAGSLVGSITATNRAILYTGPGRITSLYLANTVNPFITNLVVDVYDSPVLSNVYTNAAYTNYTVAVGFVTNIYTTPTGSSVTNRFQAIITTTNSVSANTNLYAKIASFVLKASNEQGYFINSTPLDIPIANGLVISNSSVGGSNLLYNIGIERRQ
jgi:hypothetical protein